MTPYEAWVKYVGEQSPGSFMMWADPGSVADAVREHMRFSALCAGLTLDEREAVADLLRRHIKGRP